MGFGLWANLPFPKRALWAHGLPLRGIQAKVHLTHPAARWQGAHASYCGLNRAVLWCQGDGWDGQP